MSLLAHFSLKVAMEVSVPIFVVFFWYCVLVCCTELENGSNFVELTEEPRKMISKDMMSKIIPMLVGPFMMQTMFIPIIVIFMKFTLLSSIFLGKLGVIFWIINIIKNNVEPEGEFYSHNVNVLHNDHPAHLHYPQNEGIHHWEQSAGEYSYRRRKKR